MEAYLIKKNQKKLWADIQWLLRVRGNQEYYGLCCICVKGKVMVATDGRLLHLLKTDQGIPSGVYSIIKDQNSVVFIKTDIEYVKWQSVFPKGKFKMVKEIYGSREAALRDKYYSKIIREMPDDYTLQKTYIDNILSGNSGAWTVFIFESKNSCKPLMFRTQNKTAILMPMRM